MKPDRGIRFYNKENPDSTANTICYDMPQEINYAKFGNWVISVERITKITCLESEAAYEGAEPEVYLSGDSGKAAILEWVPQVYRIEKGDTLWDIANRLYHSPNKWEVLYRQNQSVIQNRDQIYTGQMIVLPLEIREDLKTEFR